MSNYKKTYSPCDDCQYSYSKNGQEMGTCNICEYKNLQDSWENNIELLQDKAIKYRNNALDELQSNGHTLDYAAFNGKMQGLLLAVKIVKKVMQNDSKGL